MTHKSNILKIGSLNVNGGIVDKSKNKDFCSLVKDFDIFCVQETWLTDSQFFNVNEYKYYRSDRPKKNKAKRGSGGVIILFKKYLEKFVSKINSQIPDILWIKLDKTYFHLKKDLYLANCYIPPLSSTANENNMDHFGTLMEEIILYSRLGNIALCGDFNSRLGNKQENHNVSIDDFSHIYSASYDEVSDIISNKKYMFFNRISEDAENNAQGKLFMDLLNAGSLYILNGRTPGDFSGKYTCHKYNGSSTVDYFVLETGLFHEVLSMRVLEMPWFTYHCPLSLTLKLQSSSEQIPSKMYKETEKTVCTPLKNTFGMQTVI